MKLSVIVPVLDAEETLHVQLDALSRQGFDGAWEVIVADNGSTDRSMAIAESYADSLPNARIVDASDRRGAAHARNVGAEHARGRYVAFCDADDEVDDDWVAEIYEAVKEHRFVASRNDARRLSTQRGLGAKGNNRQTEGLIQYTYVPYLPFASSCGLAIEKELHDSVGGFDESMAYLEDCDYCWRIQLQGTPLVFAPDALIHIRHRSTGRGLFRQGRNWGEYDVVLLKRYREHGMPKPSLTTGLRLWAKLFLRLARVHRQAQRDKFAWNLGYRIGHVQGSLKHRILAL